MKIKIMKVLLAFLLAWPQVHAAMPQTCLTKEALLFHAAATGDLSTVVDLITKQGIDINAQDSNGNNVILLVVKLFINVLLKLNFRTDAESDLCARLVFETNPSAAAGLTNTLQLKTNLIDTLNWLLTNGADPTMTNKNDVSAYSTALKFLAQYNLTPFILILAKKQ